MVGSRGPRPATKESASSNADKKYCARHGKTKSGGGGGSGGRGTKELGADPQTKRQQSKYVYVYTPFFPSSMRHTSQARKGHT